MTLHGLADGIMQNNNLFIMRVYVSSVVNIR